MAAILARLRNNIPTPSRIASLLLASKILINSGRLPDIIISIRGGRGGLGDDIMCGIVARELRKRGFRRVWLFTRYGALFAGNVDFIAIPPDPRVLRLCDLVGIRPVELVYPPPRRPHIIALMC